MPDARDGQRILVDHKGFKGLGDIVCETLFYEALRRAHPDAWIASRHGNSLAWGNPYVDAFDDSTPDAEFDRILRLPDLGRFTLGLGAAWQEGRTVFDHFMGLVGLEPLEHPPELFVLPREMEELGLEDDGGDRLIVAFSVDSKAPDRRWGAERFQRLLTELAAAYAVDFIELGSGHTEGHMGLGLDLVGQTDLRQTMAVLSLADLFIGNHGGLTHLAGGVGTPILCPWGASHPYEAFAYDALSVAVETAPECHHCRWLGGGPAECWDMASLHGRSPCTQEISVERMLEAAHRLLPEILSSRARLRAAKAERRARARDPRTLSRFDHQVAVTPHTHSYFHMGGPSDGWAFRDHAANYAQYRKIVAFPDWLSPECPWEELIARYVTGLHPESPWLLQLGTHPLSGAEAIELVTRYINEGMRWQGGIPRIMLVGGRLGSGERAYMLDRAEACFAFGAPGTPLPPVVPTFTDAGAFGEWLERQEGPAAPLEAAPDRV